MGKIVVVNNHKGGVGKTSITYGLAHEFASRGIKVLAVDCDGQANLTADMLTSEQHAKIKYVLSDAITAFAMGRPATLPVMQVNDYIDLVPSNNKISGVDVVLSRSSSPTMVFISLLRQFANKYDIIIIDLAPTAGLFSLNVLLPADFVLIPALLEDNSLRGVIDLLTFIRNYVAPLKKIDSCLARIVLNQYYIMSRLSKSVDSKFTESLSSIMLKTKIRRNVAVGIAMRQHCSFAQVDSKCNAAKDIESLADELCVKLNMRVTRMVCLHAGDSATISLSGLKIQHKL